MNIDTVRIDIATLPDHLDRCRLNSVAASIDEALKGAGIKADCSDLFSLLRIKLRTARLASASAVLVELPLI